MTVPESSIVRPSANGELNRLKAFLKQLTRAKLWRVLFMETKKFAPIPVNKVAKIMAR